MGQTNTSTILKQEAITLAHKNPNYQVINYAEELNFCLQIAPMIDQLSFDQSSISYKISSLTINPLNYDSITFELLQREQEIHAQSKIIYKFENQQNNNFMKKYKTVTTQTEFTSKIEIKQVSQEEIKKKKHSNESFGQDQLKKQELQQQQQQQQEQNNLRKNRRSFDWFFEDDWRKQHQKQKKQYQNKSQSPKYQDNHNNTNIFKLNKNDKTENFSSDDIIDQSQLSISQNFAKLNNQFQIDEKSYIQNDKFWSSDYSSTFIEIPSKINQQSKTQKSLSQKHQELQNQVEIQQINVQNVINGQNVQNYSNQKNNEKLVYQQSFGQLKTINQQQSISPSNTQQINKFSKLNTMQQIPNQQNEYNSYSKLHNNKKNLPQLQQDEFQQQNIQQNRQSPQNQQNLIKNTNNFKSPQQQQQQPIQNQLSNQKQQQSPLQSIQSSLGSQKESMREQFDRLLRESLQKQKQQKMILSQQKQSIKSPRQFEKLKIQNYNNNYQSPKEKKSTKQLQMKGSVSPQNYQQFTSGQSYAEKNKMKKAKEQHKSPEQPIFQSLNDARKQQLNQKNDLMLDQLNDKIKNISQMNKALDDKSDRIFVQIKQDVSNLKTAITQNISPSEREERLKERKSKNQGINIDNLSEFKDDTINIDELESYRGSMQHQLQENSD